MKLLPSILAAVALCVALSLGVELKTVQKYPGNVKPDSYIVKLKAGVSKDAHLTWLAANHDDSGTVTHAEWSTDILHGFAGEWLV